MRTGIYKITNVINGKFYIGSTDSIPDRWDNHRSELRRGIHHSKHLQRAWNKHGKENFKFEVLEECLEDMLITREQWYLDTLLKAQEYIRRESNYFLKYGYNIKPLAGRGFDGMKHSVKSMDQMAKTRGANEIMVISATGEILDILSRAQYAKEKYQVGSCSLYKSINDRQLTKKGIGFIYKKDYIEGYIPTIPKSGNKKGNAYKGQKRAVDVYTIYGDYYKNFDDLHACAKHFDTTPGAIHIKLKTKNYKYLISEHKISKYIVVDKGESVAEISNKWNLVFEKIKVDAGNVQVIDCFDNVVGCTSIRKLAEYIGMNYLSVYNCMPRQTRIKSLKLIRI